MMKKLGATKNLTEGSVAGGILSFTIPLILGQLLQQLYNVADAWVVGNFADNASFAAVSSSGTLAYLIVGFFNGIAIGGGVVISHYFGAKDRENVEKAIHTNVLFGLISSVVMTVLGVLLTPAVLRLMQTPDRVFPQSVLYFRIYCAGVSTIIMYNVFMAIMRALGDSLHPLYYLCLSSVVNVVLDILFVAVFHMGVRGAAIATVASQGLSAVLCLIKMCRNKDYTGLQFRKLRFDSRMMKEVVQQGLPAGIQNSVIAIGNLVVQTNINSFGEYAVAGMGAHTRIEGFVFLPILSMSLTLSTFVSQNLGAGKYERAKKGIVFGMIFCLTFAELIGVISYIGAPIFIGLFTSVGKSIAFGVTQSRTVSLFYFLLAFSHCATGALRGCGKSIIPMAAMLSFWCGVRIVYVTIALRFVHEFRTISWAYPLTWTGTTILFLIVLLRLDWKNVYKKE